MTVELLDQKDVFNQVLGEIAEQDPRVVALSADMGTRILPEFMKRYPERFLNFGVAEQNMIAHAAGLAHGGLVPFVTTISAFLSMRAFEQIRTDVAYGGRNVKIVGTGGGLSYGVLGPTHFALEDIALLRAIPNLTLISPADAAETGWALRAAHRIDGPVYIRLDRGKVPVVYRDGDLDHPQVGRADWLRGAEGKTREADVCLIATGVMVHEALCAADRLAPKGIRANVVNVHTLKPFDDECVVEASWNARAIVTVEDHTVIGGLGSAVAACLATHPEANRIPLSILGIPDVFPHLTGEPERLRAAYGLTCDGIVAAACELLDARPAARPG